MTFASAPSKSVARAVARGDVHARALAVVTAAIMQAVALPPPSPGPGRP